VAAVAVQGALQGVVSLRQLFSLDRLLPATTLARFVSRSNLLALFLCVPVHQGREALETASITSGGGAYAGLMTEMAAFDSAFGDLAISETTLALHMPADHVTQW
jgi:hypothetical protein